MILVTGFQLRAQKILLDKDVGKAYKHIEGPNTKSFRQLFFGTGLVLPESSGIEINNLRSGYFAVGFRQKFKILSFYSIGCEIGYNALHFNLKQTDDKSVPNDIEHDKEKLRFHSANVLFFNRLNIGKRGNVIGRFIDFGAYANYIFSTSHYTKDKISGYIVPADLSEHAEIKVEKFQRLDYTRSFSYGLFARAGINWFAVKVTYRMSDLFKEKYHWPELPRYAVGIELTLPN